MVILCISFAGPLTPPPTLPPSPPPSSFPTSPQLAYTLLHSWAKVRDCLLAGRDCCDWSRWQPSWKLWSPFCSAPGSIRSGSKAIDSRLIIDSSSCIGSLPKRTRCHRGESSLACEFTLWSCTSRLSLDKLHRIKNNPTFCRTSPTSAAFHVPGLHLFNIGSTASRFW